MTTTAKTGHTPGPWEQSGGLIVHFGPLGRVICALANPPWDNLVKFEQVDMRRIADEEIKANARLIAAAPEMYEAIRDLIERHDERAKKCNFDICGCDACVPLRAAIAKAEGQP